MPAPVPASTDDISERYLKKAIAEINELGHEIAQAAGPERVPVLGSGHPLADILLLKHRPQAAEVTEGVAFYGRAGQAVLKSVQRLRVDPMAIYGTNCLKYEAEPEDEAQRFLGRELHVVQPKLVVVMGQDALACLNAVRFPLAGEVEDKPGSIQPFTPTIDALVVPDIDASLDEQATKRAFWEAFKAIGPWWSEQPPY
jgi:uracil-DNA glycosylase family 4